MDINKGSFYVLKKKMKILNPFIFGYEWKGSVRTTVQEYIDMTLNPLPLSQAWYPHDKIGRRICVDTREAFMVMDYGMGRGRGPWSQAGDSVIKVWGSNSFAFLAFESAYYELMEISNSSPELRSVTF